MPHGYFFDTSTNIAVITDSNTFSTVFNTDYPGNQITGFQLNGVDIGSRITPNDAGLFSTANNYHYLINNNNINTRFSFTKPKPRVTATNYAKISAYGIYTLYEFHHGSTGTFQLNTSIPKIVLDLNVLLIGGGGAGGHYYGSNGDVSEGAGGGGAGSYVTTTVKASSSVGLTINVGAGGAGTTGAESTGTPGSSSSISTSNYSLVAGGGGSGGAGGNVNGSYRNGILPSGGVYGSTGGPQGAFGPINSYDTSGNGYSSNDSNNTIFTNIASYVNKGGNGIRWAGGAGGGGAGGPGEDNTTVYYTYPGTTLTVTLSGNGGGGNGGSGRTWINGVTYAGGGGGGIATGLTGQDSAGGTGGGGSSAVQRTGNYGDGTANTGSGGGAAWAGNSSGNGGSGICIIAVKTSDISL